MVQVIPIPAFNDNYIWAITKADTKSIYVVDPGDAEPVLAFCKKHSFTLKGILITHHHWDHTNGVESLTQHFANIPVFGPENSQFKGISHKLTDNQEIVLPEVDKTFNVMHIPGHTLDHIAYFDADLIFCGDTLFNGGCGRLFEGSAEQMSDSLQRIAKLPDATLVYCTHEYTRANLAFAIYIEPDNQTLIEYNQSLHGNNEISLPSTIAQQKAINPFLRSHLAQVRASILEKSATNETCKTKVFARLRELKDNY